MLLRLETSKIPPDIIAVEFWGKMVSGQEIQDVERQVRDLLSKNERKFVFDLSGVDYVDSTGMGIIAQCFAIVMRADGGFRIAGASGKVKQLFRTTRLDTVMTFCPTLGVACQNFVVGRPAGVQNPW